MLAAFWIFLRKNFLFINYSCHFIYIFFSCYCPTHHPQENWQVPIIVEVAQLVKDMPAMQETQVQSLGWEDPLEKGMETYSSILAWRMP